MSSKNGVGGSGWRREREGKRVEERRRKGVFFMLMLAVLLRLPFLHLHPSFLLSLSLPFPSYSFAFYPIAPRQLCSVYIGMGIDTRHRGSLAAGAVSYPAAGMLIIGTRAP